MNYVEIATVSAAITAATTVIGLVLRGLNKIRVNDLAHVGTKLDNISQTVDRVEKKLDSHIEYHLEHKI